KDLVTPHLERIVDEFYEIQTSFQEISLLIGDAETLRRLRSAMRRYILDLFSGSYDEEYVNKRLRISKVHHRIGVSTKLYLSGMFRLQQILHKVIEEHCLERK
ncbi:MAG: GGDEF domain-containing protein, partial [Gammaproteobacteria bacterium]|nr:GGDEF domain-containing protein [Gammaproteobacteria bacterium]NIW45556.1 GGDEF domain-containing protein [Gammaproteobacteria bacterium]